MPCDNFELCGYGQVMEHSKAYLTLKLDLSEPIEALDFAQAFSSLASQFDDYLHEERKDIAAEAKIYITEVRQGSIFVDLVPLLKDAICGLWTGKSSR